MHDLAKEAWLKALRSNSFNQGIGYLSNSNLKNGPVEYCCLGVLCEVAVRNGANVSKMSKDGYVTSYDEEAGALPKSVVAWSGLDTAEPEVWYDNHNVPLTVLNDDYELSFEEIAQLVEEQL